MASRDDIVTVTINYRLSTLGFLAVPGTDVKGNFGIGDQITALEVSCIKSIHPYFARNNTHHLNSGPLRTLPLSEVTPAKSQSSVKALEQDL